MKENKRKEHPDMEITNEEIKALQRIDFLLTRMLNGKKYTMDGVEKDAMLLRNVRDKLKK